MITTALIGGSGVYVPDMLENVFLHSVQTPYGEITYSCGEIDGRKVAFIPRHGTGHSLPPHKINYHANIWGLKKIGVKYIIASTAVGSLNPQMSVGDFVIPNQLLDFTKGRSSTFFESEGKKVVHVDFTNPYCLELGKMLFDCAKKEGIDAHIDATYICAEGPRFETTAEIKMYRMLGGDIVGMTSIPESVLAREAEMCYATFSLVTNLAAGISEYPLSHQEVHDCMKKTSGKITAFLKNALTQISALETNCSCHNALNEFGGFNQ